MPLVEPESQPLPGRARIGRDLVGEAEQRTDGVEEGRLPARRPVEEGAALQGGGLGALPGGAPALLGSPLGYAIPVGVPVLWYCGWQFMQDVTSEETPA